MVNSLTDFLVWNYLCNWKQTLVDWSLGWFLSELYPITPPANQDGCHIRPSFNIEPYGKFIDKFSHLELHAHLETNFNGMVTRMVSFRIVSDDPTCQPRWLPQPNLVKHWTLWKFIIKSSRPELLAQFEPNLMEWSLGGPLLILYSISLPANQDVPHRRT